MPDRVVHFTTKHEALSTRVFHKECRTLAAAGFEVVLLAPDPPQAERDGVRFQPLPRYRALRGDPRGALADLAEVMRRALALDAALYQFHDPELIPVALALKRRGRRVVYDVHEDFPAEARALHAARPAYARAKSWAWRALEGVAKTMLDGFVAATPDIARHFPPARTIVVRNYPLLHEFAAVAAAPPYATRGPLVAYLGMLQPVRGVKEMVAAAAALGDRAQFVFAGKFDPPNYEAAVRAMPGWERVDFRGWLDRPAVAALLGTARVGIVPLHPVTAFLTSLPIKLFEYMAAGIPVVASDFPLWREIVDGAGCGYVCDPRDVTALAAAVARLLDDPSAAAAMGARGRAAVLQTYNWGPEGDRLTAFVRRLIAAP